MNQDTAQTIKSVILYIIKNSNEDKRDVYGIVKTAYFAQQNHLAEYGTPIFEDRIAALKFGPVPSFEYDVLNYSRMNKRGVLCQILNR